MTTMPTYPELAELPSVLAGEVGPDQLDANGHMNIAGYFALGNQILLARFIPLGLGTGVGVDAHGMTTFAAEHHLRYLAELTSGDDYSGHAVLVGRSAKALHALALVLSRTQERLVYTFEAMIINVDLSTRRSAAFRPEVAAALDREIATDGARSWSAPVGGAIHLR